MDPEQLKQEVETSLMRQRYRFDDLEVSHRGTKIILRYGKSRSTPLLELKRGRFRRRRFRILRRNSKDKLVRVSPDELYRIFTTSPAA